MAYQILPQEQEAEAAPAAEAAIRSLLLDLAGRKELCIGRPATGEQPPRAPIAGFGAPAGAPRLFLPGLRLHGAQLFVRNFENPNTPYPRLLINWQTGTGKSHAAATIAHEFMRSFRARAALGEQVPTVFYISFTARETIQAELLRYPEYGFVSQVEVEELRRLRAAASASGPGSPEDRHLSGFVGALRRRITDRVRGGYYEFYGYKEFANRLFVAARRESLQELFSRADGESFGERLARAVRSGEVRVNEELLSSLRRGLLICDEIHNVYNILEANNYGTAIQYALDSLGEEAPRAVYMSATPMTGSAAEVVDLLNLLVPRPLLPGGARLRRADFFTRTAAPVEPVQAASAEAADDDAEPGFIISQLREGALERIAHLAAGRVSFLLDADVGSYPKRRFEGEEVPGIPYLRLTLCPMSPFHSRTLAREQELAGAKPESAGLAPGAYTLYDMAFPNPDFAPGAAEADPASYGLYLSGETPVKLEHAPEDWQTAAGVIVEKGAEAGVAAGTYVITGPFLHLGALPAYGTKPAQVVAEAVAAIRAGPGKIMIYHHRVRMSGVLLYQEALRMNGLADETSAPTDATICSVCGIPRGGHGGTPHEGTPHEGSTREGTPHEGTPHDYTPARFVMAHSDIDKISMIRSLARYNAPTNLEGYQYRILVGSRIIREGHNFRAVRHLLVASLPTDYPTMIQVYGRVVRKDSHADLPAEQRDVRIRTFVSTFANGRVSPELQRYIDKGREYLVIQEVERALRVYAVDGFANFDRVRTALQTGPGGEFRPSLDALPYTPLVGPEYSIGGPFWSPSGHPGGLTFEAYGHGEREVATLAAVCRVLFGARPVWTYTDLWGAVRSGAVQGVNYDATLFAEGNFALALASLARPAGDPLSVVVRAGEYYVRAGARPDGSADLDVESYVRAQRPLARVSIRLADYLRDARSGENFAVRLRAYEHEFLGDESRPLELSLVEYGASFHYALLRKLILAGGAGGRRVTRDDGRVADLYRRFRIAITVADASTPAASRAYRGPPFPQAEPGALAGFITPESAVLCGPGEEWYNVSHSDFAIGRRHAENNIVVGFVVSVGESPRTDLDNPFAAFAAASTEAKFKIRPPMQKLRSAGGDVRTLARGAVCETRPRKELEAYARSLHSASAHGGALLSANDTCDTIRLRLLALEAAARAPVDGMMNGVRWVYLFHDRPPTISALAGVRP
jgi:hypothetical protein